MKFFACEADNWGGNAFPIGERGYAVLIINDEGKTPQCESVKWFPSDLFIKTFGSIENMNKEENV